MGGGTIGSRAMAGLLDPAILDKAAWDGRPVPSTGAPPASTRRLRPTRAARRAASPPTWSCTSSRATCWTATDIPIGVVEGIVGIRRYAVSFQGYANHAGTTPMHRRRDALVVAAPFITSVRDLAVAHGIVATFGTLTVEPGAPNVIPGRVELVVETRGLDEAVLDRSKRRWRSGARRWAPASPTVAQAAGAVATALVVGALAAACDDLGLARRRMPSGAGHDAMCMAPPSAPPAMLFVPSRGGVSHSPDEYTTPEDCVNGARVLLAGLLRLDEHNSRLLDFGSLAGSVDQARRQTSEV